MKVVIQRVLDASVEVDSQIIGKIDKGLLVLVGFTHEEIQEEMHWMANKISNLRVFNDTDSVMNLSVTEMNAEILVVSQFTLYASTKKGNRPSYVNAAKPNQALEHYNLFISILQEYICTPLQTGKFGADMKVNLVNDGPVTIIIDSKNRA